MIKIFKTHSRLTFEYNYIVDGIYIGTNLCCQMHFDQELLKKGIRVDISLEEKKIDSPFGVDSYLWLPTPDRKSPEMNQLLLGVDCLEYLVKTNQKVYVHCRRGHGRAPTLVAAYLIKSKKMTPEAAVNFIRKKRPAIHLEKSQEKTLINLYKKII